MRVWPILRRVEADGDDASAPSTLAFAIIRSHRVAARVASTSVY